MRVFSDSLNMPRVSFLSCLLVLAASVGAVASPRAQESPQHQSIPPPNLEEENTLLYQVLDQVMETSLQETAVLGQTNVELRETMAKVKQELAAAQQRAAQVEQQRRGALAQLTQERQATQKELAQLRAINALLEQQLQERLVQEQHVAGVYQELGTAYLKARLFDPAIDAYHRALQLDPENAQVHYYLGLLYQFARHDAERSATYLEKSLVLNPGMDPNKWKEVKGLIQLLRAQHAE